MDDNKGYGAPQDEQTEQDEAVLVRESDTRGDWYGDDTPYEDALVKDEHPIRFDQDALDEEEAELRYRRP